MPIRVNNNLTAASKNIMKKFEYRIFKTVGPWGNGSLLCETIKTSCFEEMTRNYWDWNQKNDFGRALYIPLTKPIQIDVDLYNWIIWQIEKKHDELQHYFLFDCREDSSLKPSEKMEKYLFYFRIRMLMNEMISSFISRSNDSRMKKFKRWLKRTFCMRSLKDEYDFGMKKFPIDVDLAEEWLLDFIKNEIENIDLKIKNESCSSEYYRASTCLKNFYNDLNHAVDDYYSKMGNGIIPRIDERKKFENRQKWFDNWTQFFESQKIKTDLPEIQKCIDC